MLSNTHKTELFYAHQWQSTFEECSVMPVQNSGVLQCGIAVGLHGTMTTADGVISISSPHFLSLFKQLFKRAVWLHPQHVKELSASCPRTIVSWDLGGGHGWGQQDFLLSAFGTVQNTTERWMPLSSPGASGQAHWAFSEVPFRFVFHFLKLADLLFTYQFLSGFP